MARQEELSFETRGGIARELLARWLLFALVIGFPLIYLPKVLFGGESGDPSALGNSAPAAPQPAWVHLLVITTGAVPGPLDRREAPELWAWREASAVATSLELPGAGGAANAATLWTGRWPEHHGVTSNELALVGAPWTLAEAARIGGARTAALLEAPFVTATRLRGFQDVVEDAHLDASELRAGLRQALEGAAGSRLLLWVHLSDGRAERLDTVLTELRDGFESHERWDETLAVLLPLGGAPDRSAVWVRFPGVDWSGRRGTAPLALCDMTALLRTALRVAPPDPLAHQPALQGRAGDALDVFRGWDPDLDLATRRKAAGADGVAGQPAAVPHDWKETPVW